MAALTGAQDVAVFGTSSGSGTSSLATHRDASAQLDQDQAEMERYVITSCAAVVYYILSVIFYCTIFCRDLRSRQSAPQAALDTSCYAFKASGSMATGSSETRKSLKLT